MRLHPRSDCATTACGPTTITSDIDYGGPHEQLAFTTDYDNGRWTGSSRLPRDLPERARSAGLHRDAPARHDGLPRPARDPELLGVRARLRAPGPHVRAERVVEPAARTCTWSPSGRHLCLKAGDAFSCKSQHRESRAADRHRAAARQHPARLRVDRPHLPAPQAPRELGLLHQEGPGARLREREDVLPVPGPGPADTRNLESAAELRHGPPGQPARQHPGHQRVLRGRAGQASCRPSRG